LEDDHPAQENGAMSRQEADTPLPQERRRDIFRALVEAQDGELTVAQSRQAVAERYGLSQEQLRRVEREGLDGHWPPL
jgi:hypothetical protein